MYGRLVHLLSLFVAPAILSPASRIGDKIAGATCLLLILLALALWQAFREGKPRAAQPAPPVAPPFGGLVALACRASDEDRLSRNPDPAEIPFNVRLLAFLCARRFAVRAASKGLGLKTAVAGDVPSLVLADRSRILPALANLLDNAVKFTDEGVVRLEVAFNVRQSQLRFTVYDTGAGMDSETLARVLGPPSPTSSRGLFVSQRLIALMGGTMGAESEPRGGSTVWFSVPVEVVEPAPVARPRPTHQSLRPVAITPRPLLPRAAQPGKRVLIVDEDAATQVAAVWGVRALGYSGEAVSSGKAALDAWRSAPFDLVLLDGAMPEAGLAIQVIRRLETGCVPILALSSPAGEPSIPATAIDGSLAKPLCLLELARTLDHWLGEAAPAYTSDASSDKLSLPV